MVLITIVNGVYKPTYNWGAPPCMLTFPVPGVSAPIAMLPVLDLLAALGGLLPSSEGSTCPAADERWCADMGTAVLKPSTF